MELKKVFEAAENGALTYEQFEELAKQHNAKFVDLSGGEYVSAHKYNDDLAAKAKEIETLNGTITTRDTDLAELKKQLEAAGADAAKLQEVTEGLTALQTKYDGDIKSYKEQLKKQAYTFAAKEYASQQKFTSAAARREFERALIDKDLKMDKDKILGADDFLASYKADNSDSFATEPDTGGNEGGNDDGEELPHFVMPGASGGSDGGNDPTGGFHFNFTGVRPMPEK